MSAVLSQVGQAEADSNLELLSSVPGDLHQIHGSLKMVELEAAGILAERLEVFCQKLYRSNHLTSDLNALPQLRSGLEALRVYIDAVARQAPVSPLMLADQINNISVLVGRSQISQFDLFFPPLEQLLVDRAAIQGVDGKEAEVVAHEGRDKLIQAARKKYRYALLRWLMGKPTRKGRIAPLSEIQEAFKHLIRTSSLDISQQLWWVASGFVDAVAIGDISVNRDVKSQFARLDGEVSRLLDESPANIATDPPDELLRQLLFYIGAIEKSESETVRKIQQVLDLPKWFALSQTPYHELTATSLNLRKLGAKFGQKEFDQIEKLLGDYFSDSHRAENSGGDDKVYKQLASLLEKLSGLAVELELQPLASLGGAIARAIAKIDKSDAFLNQSSGDIKIASAILFVRNSVVDHSNINAGWQDTIASYQTSIDELITTSEAFDGAEEVRGRADTSEVQQIRTQKVAEAEYSYARSAAANHLQIVLEEIEAKIIQHQALGSSFDELPAIEKKLLQSSRLFTMVEHVEAAKLSALVASVISQIDASARTLNPPEVEALAFAIAALSNGANQVVQPVLAPDSNMAAAYAGLQGLIEKWTSDEITREAGIVDSPIEETVHKEDGEFDDSDDDLVPLLEEKFESVSVTGLDKLDKETPSEDSTDAFHVYSDIDYSDFKREPEQAVDAEKAESLPLLLKDDNLKAIFIEEFGRHIDQLDSDINRLSRGIADPVEFAEVMRTTDHCVHTLSGNCRNLGFELIADCVEEDVALLHVRGNDVFFKASIGHFSSGIKLLRNAHQHISETGQLEADLITEFSRHGELCSALKSAGGAFTNNKDEPLVDSQVEGNPLQEDQVEEEQVEAKPKSFYEPVQPDAFRKEDDGDIIEDAAGKIEDDIDEEIRQIFLEEAEGILGRLNSHLIEWKENTLSIKLLGAIKREFHTLKGSAAATGYFEISQLSHTLESFLDEYTLGPDMDNSGILNLLEEVHDGLAADLGFMITSGTEGHVATLNKMLEGLLSGGDAVSGDTAKEDTADKDTIREDIASEDTTNEDTIEENAAGGDTADEDTVEEDIAGEDTVGEDKIEEDIVDEETVHEDTAEEDVVVEETANEDTVEEDVAVEEIASEDTVEENVAGEDTVDEDKIEEDVAVMKIRLMKIRSKRMWPLKKRLMKIRSKRM